MSLQQHLEKLKSLLSQDDLIEFERLTTRMAEVKGDFTQLTDKELSLIAKMEQKYGDPIRDETLQTDPSKIAEEVTESGLDTDSQQVVKDEFPLLNTEFAGYVKDMLLRELGQRFPDLKSAVNFAFENKWLPDELKNPDVCETLFERFFSDIERANQWRKELQGQEADLSNKPLSIGLTWFMYIFQLKQSVDRYS